MNTCLPLLYRLSLPRDGGRNGERKLHIYRERDGDVG